jgi:excisionase family DNA binding protein
MEDWILTKHDVCTNEAAIEGIEQLLTKQQLIDYLQVTGRTIERWMKSANLPYYKLGLDGRRRQLRFDKQEIKDWLNDSKGNVVNG